MRAMTAPLALAMFGALSSASAQQTQVGRFQIVAAPALSSQAAPEILLLDSATGQTWTLFQEPGQPVQWRPVRFSIGKDRPLVPLPAGPDVVGTSH